MKSFFPSTVSPYTTFEIHDIAEPWPAELHGTCDLVHQRFTILGGTKKATARDIVRYLCQLVIPGGWIQLVEMDVTVTAHGPAMRDAWAATGAFLTAAGAGTDYGKSMAGWLKEEAFEKVNDNRVNLDVGARCNDAEWGARGANILVEAFTGVVGACKMMKLEVPDSILQDLPERARKEMMEQGDIYPLVFAYGRKPTA
ncbi:hypothetical protein GGR55DRAFT_619312 [Xylaria sp. FL0064]|nr:hypothetical protein GGR55DRAFT_619312 [Xylaria sp. FL0064]